MSDSASIKRFPWWAKAGLLFMLVVIVVGLAGRWESRKTGISESSSREDSGFTPRFQEALAGLKMMSGRYADEAEYTTASEKLLAAVSNYKEAREARAFFSDSFISQRVKLAPIYFDVAHARWIDYSVTELSIRKPGRLTTEAMLVELSEMPFWDERVATGARAFAKTCVDMERLYRFYNPDSNSSLSDEARQLIRGIGKEILSDMEKTCRAEVVANSSNLPALVALLDSSPSSMYEEVQMKIKELFVLEVGKARNFESALKLFELAVGEGRIDSSGTIKARRQLLALARTSAELRKAAKFLGYPEEIEKAMDAKWAQLSLKEITDANTKAKAVTAWENAHFSTKSAAAMKVAGYL